MFARPKNLAGDAVDGSAGLIKFDVVKRAIFLDFGDDA